MLKHDGMPRENFRGWLKNREIRKSFLPRKFPAIQIAISTAHAQNTPSGKKIIINSELSNNNL